MVLGHSQNDQVLTAVLPRFSPRFPGFPPVIFYNEPAHGSGFFSRGIRLLETLPDCFYSPMDVRYECVHREPVERGDRFGR